ncbi:MAG: L-rhamnose mutarotase [Clostridia bacterium]|nr:L-rhamnose mutarotase [Clostridia bacterium]
MKRFIRYSQLKPEKIEDYVNLHKEPWPELLALLSECGISNYSISLRGDEVFTYFEYVGEDYDADMEKLDASDVMQKWWVFSKPCFLHHEQGEYYEDLTEVFYMK